MYRNAYQRGMISVLFSGGSKPLSIWETTQSKDGYINRFLDKDIKAMVIEIGGNNVSTTYVSCPPGKQVLGISMPFLVMIVKNLKKYFVFEITILDETGTRRRFRLANFQSTTQIGPLCTAMPLQLSDGWNQIQFNLAEFTRRAYNKQYIEVQKIKINANIRIRRIYCAERLMSEEELPPEYKLYFPIMSKKKEKDKENRKYQTTEEDNRKIENKVDLKPDKDSVTEATLAGASAPLEVKVDVKPDKDSFMEATLAGASAPPQVKVDVKPDKDSSMEATLAGASAPPEVVPADGAAAKLVATEEVPAETMAGDSALDTQTREGEPGGETDKGETQLADEMPDVEAAELQTLQEGEAPEVEELAGEVSAAAADLEVINEALPSAE